MVMPTLPLHTVVPPSSANSYINGSAPAHLLRDPGDKLGPLMIEPSYGMQALHLLALEKGFVVETTGRGRTLKQQTDLFLSRMIDHWDPALCTTADQRVCVLDQRGRHPSLVPGHRWYKRKNVAACASPGTSPHGRWCADDMSQEWDGDPETDPVTEAFIRWLVPLAKQLGFAWSLQSEPWHLQWIAGDVLPPLVVQTLTRYNVPVPGNPPPPSEDYEMTPLPDGSVRAYDSRDIPAIQAEVDPVLGPVNNGVARGPLQVGEKRKIITGLAAGAMVNVTVIGNGQAGYIAYGPHENSIRGSAVNFDASDRVEANLIVSATPEGGIWFKAVGAACDFAVDVQARG